MDDFEKLLQESLQDPEFKKEWEVGQPDYEVMRMIIKKRNKRNLAQKESSELSGIRHSNNDRVKRCMCSEYKYPRKKLKIEFV